MTAKSMRLATLPLLGSNQDSPDPESEGRVGLRGVAEIKHVDFPQISAEAHRSIPTISHPLPVLVRGADWAGTPIVYGLVDPLEPERIRYVGRTEKMPAVRYVQHMLASRGNGRRRMAWVAELVAAGRAPDMVLLEAVERRSTLETREMEWIRDLKADGMADLNGALPNWFLTGDRAEGVKRRRRTRFKRTGVRVLRNPHTISHTMAGAQ